MRTNDKVAALERFIERREAEHAEALTQIREVLLFAEALVGGMLGHNSEADWVLERRLAEIRAALALTEPRRG